MIKLVLPLSSLIARHTAGLVRLSYCVKIKCRIPVGNFIPYKFSEDAKQPELILIFGDFLVKNIFLYTSYIASIYFQVDEPISFHRISNDSSGSTRK